MKLKQYVCNFCSTDFGENFYKRNAHIQWCDLNPNKCQIHAHSKLSDEKRQEIYKKWSASSKTKESQEKRNLTYRSNDELGLHKNFNGRASSEEKEIERRRKISETMKRNPKSGGLREGSGRGKKQWYNSVIAGKVYTRSTYELAYVTFLDKMEIKWKQNNDFFYYSFNGKQYKYYPDFYLIDDDLFIEIKGYKTLKDEEKWKVIPNLKILFRNDLLNLGIDI